MALSESSSTVTPNNPPPQRSHLAELRNTLLSSRTPPGEVLHTIRHYDHLGISSYSPQTRHTHGGQAPQLLPQEESKKFHAKPIARTWDTRSARISSPSYSRPPSSLAAISDISAKQRHGLSLSVDRESDRHREVQDERAERRASLSHRPKSARDVADGVLAEYQRSLLPQASSRASSPPREAHTPHNASVTGAEILATVLQEKHNLDLARSSRALRIRNAVTKFLDEISTSIDGVPGKLTQQSLGSPSWQTSATPFKWQNMVLENEDISETSAQDQSTVKYSCPFRKRNSLRFNIRDHERCARAPFSSMSELRKHILSYHKSKSVLRQCRRCHVQFASELALSDHLMLPKDKICEVAAIQNEDPEDGLSEDAEMVLSNKSEDLTWETLWDLLFPSDTDIPNSDFQSIIELAEVDQAFDISQDPLKANLRATLRVLLPADIGDDYCSFLAGQLELVFDTHRANVMRQCLNVPVLSSKPKRDAFKPSSPEQQPQLSSNFARRSTRRRSRQSSTFTPSPISPTPSRISNTYPSEFTRPYSYHVQDISPESPPAAQYEPRLAFFDTTPPTPPPTEDEDNGAPYIVATNPTLIDPCTSPSRSDLRDSGIAMPCETCERDNDSCRCTLDQENAKGNIGIAHNKLPRGIILGNPHQQHILRRQQSVRFDKCASTLGYSDTSSIDARSGSEDPFPKYHGDGYDQSMAVRNRNISGTETVNINGSGSGRFSPQSFKQRVLREKLSGGIQYHATGLGQGVHSGGD